MQKYFNTTGLCLPKLHYIINPLRNLDEQLGNLIRGEQYFLLHAPRQTGKTTLLHSLAHRINQDGKYIASVCSVEIAGYASISVADAMHAIITSIHLLSKIFLTKEQQPPEPKQYQADISLLQTYLSDWSHQQDKPIVLLIDEVDSLLDDVLISVLRQLRSGFQSRPKNFPVSIALVGLRDIRDYKMLAKENRSIGTGSPFNIKADSLFLTAFSKTEVQQLLEQHTQATGQLFITEVQNKIFEYSGGQPWLCNAIANEIVARILKNDFSKKITLKHVEQAKENLIKRRDTHLDSLVDKLKEERVRKVITSIINGEDVFFDGYDDAIRYCRDLGIITPTSPIQFANPIYREITTRIMNGIFQDNIYLEDEEKNWYIHPNGQLNMEVLLQAFQEFYREHSESWIERFEYQEAGHQLLLMAYLQRVINGGGRIDREMAVGRGRTDLVVEWRGQRFVLELKLKHRPSTKSKGLKQLSKYLDKLGLTSGYLIIFEMLSTDVISWENRLSWTEEIYDGKEITVIEM